LCFIGNKQFNYKHILNFRNIETKFNTDPVSNKKYLVPLFRFKFSEKNVFPLDHNNASFKIIKYIPVNVGLIEILKTFFKLVIIAMLLIS